ncbi:MAG TPA: hypothetical protein VN635_10435 [Conexibacter sp.]|nr:hypothetical protein [Conexibacter sp.]
MSRSHNQRHAADPGEWYAVRCIFVKELDAEESATFRYEERITLWRAGSAEEAIALAEAEADEYGKVNEVRRPSLAQAYHLFDPPSHGEEVFSLMRDSSLSPSAYLDRFFDTGTERQMDAE